jgi:peptidoglycan-associated lipoprotein
LNSSEVDFEARSILEEQINFISVNPNYSVLIEGHCDERGTREYNLALGERRADSVKRFISSFGIDPDRISTISYGKEKPAVEGASQDIWSKNRRAEIVIE